MTCEPFQQWILQDCFSAGRPAWDRVGVQLVDDVHPYELMKKRLLNAGHQTIAYPGRLLGHLVGHSACADPVVGRLLEHYLRHEGSMSLPEVPGVDLDEYCSNVLKRLANVQIQDSMTRLCDESSTMLSTHVLPVVRSLLSAGRDASAAIAVVACWARFLEGTDDVGTPIEASDTRAVELRSRAARHESDLLAVVRDNPLFAGLEDRRSFVEPYVRTLDAIRTKGTRAALEDVLLQATTQMT